MEFSEDELKQIFKIFDKKGVNDLTCFDYFGRIIVYYDFGFRGDKVSIY